MRGALFAFFVGIVLPFTGCASIAYVASINAASTRLEQARAMGAETKAPFEYTYAREHLRQAQVEAAEASYGDAVTFADTAESFAQKAIDRIESERATAAAVGAKK